ncbi:MAG: hypothetical protein ABS74_19250 [Pelagibacterium sp. SCN 63-126]|jgi:hypothetical protein|nr:MAG: hypothetical protein ABS74_19250 [Pelagibacterium sp. SCN 63-126]
MIWELVAIWAIVLGTIVWFIRAERQRRATPDEAAIAYPAHERKLDPAGLAELQRRFVRAVDET